MKKSLIWQILLTPTVKSSKKRTDFLYFRSFGYWNEIHEVKSQMLVFNAICLTSKAFRFSKKKKISSTNIGTPSKSARAAEAKYRHWKDGKRFVIRHIGMSKMWSTWKRNGGTSWLVALTTDCSRKGGGGELPPPSAPKAPSFESAA